MLLFFVGVVGALRLDYVSPTRVDIVTDHYVRLERLELCYNNVCQAKECDPTDRVLSFNENVPWDCLQVTLTELHADGTVLRDSQEMELRRPPPQPLHVWWMVDAVVLLVAAVGIFAAVKYIPEHLGHRRYSSQVQKDRQLVDKLPNVYRSYDDHDNL